MHPILNKIHSYLLNNKNFKEENLLKMDRFSITLAMEIAMYAHRNQKRANNVPYFTHPYRVLTIYRQLFHLLETDSYAVDYPLVTELDIPFNGVQELCLLHDVIEDSDEFTIDVLDEIFTSLKMGDHFKEDIAPSLETLTHDKNVPYQDYISLVMEDKKASLVKMLDLFDNTNLFSLESTDDKSIERTKKYVDAFKRINDRFHYVEKIHIYGKKLKEKKTRE